MSIPQWRQIRLFVEGFEDKLFVERILVPRLQQYYLHIQLHEYSQTPQETLLKHFQSLTRIPNTVFFVLIDFDRGPCLQGRRHSFAQKFSPHLPPTQVLIVHPTIEAWYCAGVPHVNRFGAKIPTSLSSIDKNRFKRIFGELTDNPQTRKTLLADILDEYDWQLALQRSVSLRYCAQKLGI